MLKTFWTVLIVLILNASAFALEVEVVPGSVYPGDAFAVRVTNASEKPIGVYEGGWLHFGACGEGCYVALGVVDLDEPAGSEQVTVSVDDVENKLEFQVQSKEFPTTDITLQPDKVTLSAEDEERVQRETAMLKELWKKVTDRQWEGAFIIPVENSFSTVFGVKRIMNKVRTSVHTGLDIRGRTGTPVKATNSGTVVVVEDLFYGGYTVALDHGQGIYSYYMHLSKYNVSVGDVVEKGAVVGEVGATGRATGPHLHFGIKISETNSNPLSVIKLPL